jgi:predicted dehydrogenase
MKVGLCSFAHVHAEGYAGLLANKAGVELLAADDDLERGRSCSAALGIRFVGTFEDLFATRPDAVVICVENVRHRALVEAAARAGAHVLCEKPLATTLADAGAMIGACERAGVLLMTAFPVRFSPAVRTLAELVREGRLGELLACTGTNQGQMPGSARAWFVDPAQSGGGAVFDHTVHLADILDWILGPAVEVYAQTNRICHADTVQVETGGLLAVTYGDGTVATIDCSWDRPDTYPTWGGVTLEMVGARGSVAVDAFRQVVTHYDDANRHVRSIPWGTDLDARMLNEFLSAVRDGRRPQPDGEAGRRAMEVALGAYRSAELGQPVTLPLEG